jgi:hypothetical protein
MLRFRNRLVVIFFATVAVSHASAAETIRVVFGGPALAREFEAKQAEMEKAVGGAVEIKVMPHKTAVLALDRGLVDVVSGSLSFVETTPVPVKDAKEVNEKKFEAFEFRRLPLFFGVNPKNSVKSLTQQQVTEILSGKIKSWESINGQKLPITVYTAKNYANSNSVIVQKYLNAQLALVATQVVDKDGLMRLIQMDPGGIGLFPSKESTASFTPDYLPAGVELVLTLLLRKNISPRGRKLVEYLKSNKG